MKTASEQFANRLHLIGRDIQEAQRYLHAYQELSALPGVNRLTCHWDLLMACMSAAIVACSRGFVQSKSSGQASKMVNFNNFDIANEKWAVTLHDQIITKRHQAVAHSDWKVHYTVLDTTLRAGGAARLSSIPQILNEIDAKKFLELTSVLFREVAMECHDLDRQTLSNIQK